jgi:hypothetical protein
MYLEKWLWTAITRATDLSKVKFYNGKCAEFDQERFRRYLKTKVANYSGTR